MVGAVTTTTRMCTIGCIPSTTTECCTTNLCNKAGDSIAGLKCYGCTTTSNNSTDPCLSGNVTSPIMASYICPAQSKDCYMESTSKLV